MLFNSYIFIFAFLPIALILFYGLGKLKNKEYAKLSLVLASFVFYGYYNWKYLPVLAGSLLVNYGISALIKKYSNHRKALMITGVSVNLIILFICKYFDFFISNINSIFKTEIEFLSIMMPLGISFFTFQQISFIVDRYKNEAPHYGIIDYAAFVTFFPQLVAGPIVLHSQLLPQFEKSVRKGFSAESFYKGIAYFTLGLAKKVLIADFLGQAVDYAFINLEGMDTLGAILVALSYSMQLFFDFSGYSDMAIGLGLMFGLELPVNFNAPFTSINVKDFWRRWHITLGNFFTHYLYIPLGGNRKGLPRTLLNVMIVFSLSGLWHGANWTFVVWGVLHGIGVALANIFEKMDISKSTIFKAFTRMLTFVYVVFAFVIFRSSSLTEAVLFFKRLLTGGFYSFSQNMASSVSCPELYIFTKAVQMKASAYVDYWYLAIFLLVLIFALLLSQLTTTKKLVDKILSKKLTPVVMAILLVWCIISLSGVSEFIYFNF